jgi:hypothetical protein
MIKVPCLNRDEAQPLLTELKKVFEDIEVQIFPLDFAIVVSSIRIF